jgi:DNA-binding MarR family transcriptional regulator
MLFYIYMSDYMEVPVKPFGYWLKHIDTQLEATFVRLLAEEGLNRRQWQILNTIASGAHTIAEIDEAAKPFLTEESFQPVVDSLAARGWVADYRLTPAGQVAFDSVSGKVQAFRGKVTAGLSEDEYVTLVRLLERVAANVG